jgi:hypothetical protein
MKSGLRTDFPSEVGIVAETGMSSLAAGKAVIDLWTRAARFIWWP